MPRQLLIDDHIEMRGDALHRSNMDGPWQPTKAIFMDDFTDDTLATDRWTATVTNGTIAVDHSTYSGGQALFTTGANHDNECSYLGSAVCWEDDLYALCEFKILITDVSGVCLYAGFSDEATETTPNMPIDYADGTLANIATNAVGFVCDFDDSVNGINSIVAVGVNAGTLETAIDSGTDWADGEWHTLRVELDPDGDAVFYLDGTSFGRMPTAVASGTKLCMMIAVANRDTGADTVYVDYAYACQDREV